MRPVFVYMIFYLIIGAVIVFDRIVKHMVVSGMTVGETIAVAEDIFHITYVRNQGAAFSILEQQWILLIALPAIALAAGLVIIWLKRNAWSRCLLTSVALICGGGIGNLLDRICNGYVVDMFDCRFIPFMDFPVFNIADISICVGCGLMLLDVIFLEGKREKK